MSIKRRILRVSGILLIILAVMLGIYVLAAYLGWQSGQQLRAEVARAEIERQLELAEEDIGRENYRLALRRLEWVLEQIPDHSDALALQSQASEALAAPTVPTPRPSPTPNATSTTTAASLDEDAAGDEAEAEAELRRLRALISEEEWEEAIPAVLAFQRKYPSYQRRETDEMLFEVYVRHGEALLYTQKVEQGLYYLEQAEALGLLPVEVSDQRQWAELYLSGISFYGVNWDVAIFYFRDLCLAAPFFHDACQKLEAALLARAEQFAAIQEWCPAEPLFAEAFQINGSAETQNRLAQARNGCAGATPTPSVPLTGTVPLTDTAPITNTTALTGSFGIWP